MCLFSLVPPLEPPTLRCSLYICVRGHLDTQSSLAEVVYINTRRLDPNPNHSRLHEGHLMHNQGKYLRLNLIFF